MIFSLSAEDNSDLFNPNLNDTPPTPVDDGRFIGEFFYMLLMLGLLIGGILFATSYLRKLTNKRIENLNNTSNIKILETRILSHKSHLHLVEVENKIYLIAESSGAISTIEVLSGSTDTKN